MTQKELLYLEDAVGHEENIIEVCEDTIGRLSDENLISFLSNEVEKHKSMKNKLINMLEKKSNEWSNIDG